LCYNPAALCFDDAIIAIVNEDIITMKDLSDYLNSVYTQLKMEGTHTETQINEIMDQVEKDGINRLIDDRILLNAANEHGVEAKRFAIDEEIDKIKARYPSEPAFISSLTTEGLTITDLRNYIADKLKVQFFVDNEIKSTIQINPQKITDFYNANIKQFLKPERVDLDSIFISYGSDAAQAKEQAAKAYALLTAGNAFSDVAKQFSSAPSVGIIARGQMKPDIEDTIFALNEDGFTQPIESLQGVFIFKLKSHFPEETASLEESKDQIAQFLFNKEFKEKLKSWLDEEKKKTYIEIKKPQ
jgi:parvulin-like peptidyl-prolyl isomerase